MTYRPARMRFGAFIAPFHGLGDNPTLAFERDMQLIELLDHWLSRHDRDANPRVHGSGRMRAGVSIFSFEESLSGQAKEV